MAKYPVYTENMQLVLSDLLIFEIDARWSREEATLSASEKDLPLGTVLEKSGTELIPLTTEGQPYAILARNEAMSEAPQTTMILRRGVIIHKDKLIFEAGINSDITIATLNNLGIVAQ